MSTLVCFHAHPDDEAITTGGTIARAAAEGHRVVLVVATNGDHGEKPDDLAPGETLVERRRAETAASAEALGISRVVWLGYTDSGMTGWDHNADPQSFFQAPLEEAAQRLAAVLTEEAADVVTVYDWHGNYGHPDHIKVNTVGHRAAEIAGTARVLEATMNRDHIRRVVAMARQMGQSLRGGVEGEDEFDPDGGADDGNPMGTPEADITLSVDASAFASVKRASLAAHRSQVTDTSFFISMPDDVFALSFGTEWFIEKGIQPGTGPRLGWIFE
jgi:LmbE family N-acetylglucosaminyl deacetylase